MYAVVERVSMREAVAPSKPSARSVGLRTPETWPAAMSAVRQRQQDRIPRFKTSAVKFEALLHWTSAKNT